MRAEIKGCPIAERTKQEFEQAKAAVEAAWTEFVHRRADHEAAWQTAGGWGTPSDHPDCAAQLAARSEAHDAHEQAKSGMIRARIGWHCSVTDHYSGRHPNCRPPAQEEK